MEKILMALDETAKVFYLNVLLVLIGASIMANDFAAGAVLSGLSVPLSLVYVIKNIGRF